MIGYHLERGQNCGGAPSAIERVAASALVSHWMPLGRYARCLVRAFCQRQDGNRHAMWSRIPLGRFTLPARGAIGQPCG